MILDIPELLLKVAHFSDWRAVLALQRLNRGAYRDRPTLVQEELWRCAVRSRWCGQSQSNNRRSAWAVCGSWRRVYAHLRTVKFTTSASLWDYRRLASAKVPSLRVSRTPAYNPRYGLGARNPPLSRVEECVWSEEPLARRERQREIRDIHFHAALADVRPNLLPGPEVWVAHFTVWAPDADAILLGVRTDDGDEAWYFDIGDHLDHLGEGHPRRRVVHFWELNESGIDDGTLDYPVQFRLVVDLVTSAISITVEHTSSHSDMFGSRNYFAHLAYMDAPGLAAAAAGGSLHFFVGFGVLYYAEEDAGCDLPSDVDDWDPWSDHYPERQRRRGYATLDRLYPMLSRRLWQSLPS